MSQKLVIRTLGVVLSCALVVGWLGSGEAGAWQPFEVWAVDQSGNAGTLYIYDGAQMNDGAAHTTPAVLALDSLVTPLCLSETGTAPVRGHMLGLNSSHSHLILSYVATGHVVFIETATRTPVDCIDVGAQAHAAFASPDSQYVFVANQNGKLFQRISTDYATNTFTLDSAATLDLATCTTPNGAPCQDAVLRPDNAPICPVIDSSSRLVFVTLRGGGMFVLDGTTTPMSIIAEYDRAIVNPNGCLGVESNGRMYINSGGGTAANPMEEDIYSFPLADYPSQGFNWPNTPAPAVILNDDNGDSHGGVRLPPQQGRFVWVADRMNNEVRVIDTSTDSLVNTFSLSSQHSVDPSPDLMDVNPNGQYAYAALRGPCPLTGNSLAVNNAVGATPGIGVLAIQRGGFTGKLVAVAPISNPSTPFTCTTVGGNPTLDERADVHSLLVVRR
jgi:DNA-binding beta-propeller fold protein YncE